MEILICSSISVVEEIIKIQDCGKFEKLHAKLIEPINARRKTQKRDQN